MKKRLISTILILFMSVALIPFSTFSASAAKSGKIGNCTWRLEGTVLTISGEGDMGNSVNMGYAPWGKKITEVIIKEGVTNIGGSAFMDCESLKSVTFPSTLRIIGDSAFNGCKSLTNISLPDGVEEIGWHCFMYCESILQIKIPKSLTTIGIQSFDDCYSLKNIAVDEDNPSYTSVNGVLFNKDMTELIKYPPAKGSHYMDSYTIPDGVKKIAFHAFEGATMLGEIHIPSSVILIESQAFYRTQAYWNSVRSGEDVFYIGDCLIEATNREKNGYTIKEGTRVIASTAFSHCASMKKITVPDGVEHIGSDAFWNCKALKGISLPSTLKAISSTAFLNTPLQKVFFRGSEADRRKIDIATSNDELKKATWYFDACYTSEKHSFGNDTVISEAECGVEGLSEKICKTCGFVKQDVIPAFDHEYGIVSQVTAPTCVSAGIEASICKICGYNDERYVEPTGHIFGAWREEIAPTCTEIGIMKRYCAMCDMSEAQIINATGHDYDIFNVIKEPTVSEEGYKAAACMVCGDIKTEVIPRDNVRGVISVWQMITVGIGVVAFTSIVALLVVIAKKNKKLRED